MNFKATILTMALLLGMSAAAGEPYNVKNCGFSVSEAAKNALFYYSIGQALDCLFWGCIPILGGVGVGVGAGAEIDDACAGVVYAGESKKGEYVGFITWNEDSLAAARSSAKGACESKGFRNCHQLLEFRHAGAVYRTGPGGRLYVGQAIDLATAKEIARGRCERATGSRCQLALARRNRN